MDTKRTYISSLIKIKEGQLKFFSKVLNLAEEYVQEEYPEGNAKAYVKNNEGFYEIFIEVEEDE